MTQFYVADVRKRARAELNLPTQVIAEERMFVENNTDERAVDSAKDYQGMLELFSRDGAAIPDEAVNCALTGCEGISLEWTAGTSAGQIDFYAGAEHAEEPECFLSLYFMSGMSAEEDRQTMKPLEQYADFGQCTRFPLVLQLVDESQSAVWKHEALGKMRLGMPALEAAFLKIYFAGALAK